MQVRNGELRFNLNDFYPNMNQNGTTRTQTNIDSKDANTMVEDEKMVAKVDTTTTTKGTGNTVVMIVVIAIVLLALFGWFNTKGD